jgi:hypothetical protein
MVWFVLGMSTLVPLVWIFFGFFFCYASWLEALVLAYGLNESLLACIWFFSCLGSALKGITFIFGTLVLLLHGTFGVKFIQHMTSFHC